MYIIFFILFFPFRLAGMLYVFAFSLILFFPWVHLLCSFVTDSRNKGQEDIPRDLKRTPKIPSKVADSVSSMYYLYLC